MWNNQLLKPLMGVKGRDCGECGGCGWGGGGGGVVREVGAGDRERGRGTET